MEPMNVAQPMLPGTGVAGAPGAARIMATSLRGGPRPSSRLRFGMTLRRIRPSASTDVANRSEPSSCQVCSRTAFMISALPSPLGAPQSSTSSLNSIPFCPSTWRPLGRRSGYRPSRAISRETSSPLQVRAFGEREREGISSTAPKRFVRACRREVSGSSALASALEGGAGAATSAEAGRGFSAASSCITVSPHAGSAAGSCRVATCAAAGTCIVAACTAA
mmetsp:Transcript_158731/g.280393  ORF Transcript_158731/g.280393 Transcript_158731/m.280393 type:complete len:221 (-) Transcript_158731:11-673(-)